MSGTLTLETAVVLAAGRGSRLLPLSLNRSKGMLPIVGRPMIERVLDNLAGGGIQHFILVRSPADKELTHYFGDLSTYRGRIRIVEQPEPLGSADALARAAPLLTGGCLVSACDNLVNPKDVHSLRIKWEQERPDALLALMPVRADQVSSTGIVAIFGAKIIQLVEKPFPQEAPSNLASLPLYAFSERIFGLLNETPRSPRGEYELPGAIQRLIDLGGEVRGMQVSSRLTLTTPVDLLAINRLYLCKMGDRISIGSPIFGTGAEIFPPVHIDSGVTIGSSCQIGPEVYVESGCVVGSNSVVRRSVLLRGAVVPENSSVEAQILPG